MLSIQDDTFTLYNILCHHSAIRKLFSQVKTIDSCSCYLNDAFEHELYNQLCLCQCRENNHNVLSCPPILQFMCG